MLKCILITVFFVFSINAHACQNNFWEYISDNSIYSVEAGLLQPGVVTTYGYDKNNGSVILPDCEVVSPQGKLIKLPVLLIDWQDYDPKTDLSNPNNPDSGQDPNYVKQIPEQIESFLNGESGPAEYFKDVSKGKLLIEFDVIGWITSSESGYLKHRSEYMHQTQTGQWICDRDQVMRDAVAESIAFYQVDWNDYDIDKNSHSNVMKNADGAILLYEGMAGECSGTNMSWLDGGSLPAEDTLSGYFGFTSENLKLLSNQNIAGFSAFEGQNVLLNRYINIPEDSVQSLNTGAWAHELGHLLLGFADYYDVKFNIRGWSLSGANGVKAFHPSAYEKWMFGGWIEPTDFPSFGSVTIDTNQHADDDYSDDQTQLYKYNFNASSTQYLTAEYHWFENEGNAMTDWAPNQWASSSAKQSGVLINIFDLTKTIYDAEPQILRLQPTSNTLDSELLAFQAGQSVDYCYSNSRCIHLAVTHIQGATAGVYFSEHENGFSDYDRDGFDSESDRFPYDAQESLDTDSDGMGNNADPDDDNDGMPDSFEAQYGLDPLDSSDATEDKDNDGVSNLQEYLNGTDPTFAENGTISKPKKSGGGSLFVYFMIFTLLSLKRGRHE